MGGFTNQNLRNWIWEVYSWVYHWFRYPQHELRYGKGIWFILYVLKLLNLFLGDRMSDLRHYEWQKSRWLYQFRLVILSHDWITIGEKTRGSRGDHLYIYIIYNYIYSQYPGGARSLPSTVARPTWFEFRYFWGWGQLRYIYIVHLLWHHPGPLTDLRTQQNGYLSLSQWLYYRSTSDRRLV